jgi:tryptophanyl-tRNA synthetase
MMMCVSINAVECTSVLISYQELKKIGEDYRKGEMLTGEVCFRCFLSSSINLANHMMQLKAICIKHLQEYVAGFQERREKATDEVVDVFMSRRPLKWKGNPKVERIVPVSVDSSTKTEGDGDGKMTKNQLKKLEKEKWAAAKKAAKAAEKEAAKETEAVKENP